MAVHKHAFLHRHPNDVDAPHVPSTQTGGESTTAARSTRPGKWPWTKWHTSYLSAHSNSFFNSESQGRVELFNRLPFTARQSECEKKKKENTDKCELCEKTIGTRYMSRKQLFQIWWASQVKIFLSLHKNELLAIPATCFTSAQQHSEAICPRLYEHRPCCGCHFASRREGTKGKKNMVLLALKHCGQQLCEVESCETQPAWHSGT